MNISTGVAAAEHAAFVLVAGGLGERLGYSGIKVKLPVDSARSASFLQVDLCSCRFLFQAAQLSSKRCRLLQNDIQQLQPMGALSLHLCRFGKGLFSADCS